MFKLQSMFEYYRSGRPLVVETGVGGIRVIAGMTLEATGVMFADVFWRGAIGRHPFHLLKGKVTGKGPWKVGGKVIRPLIQGEDASFDWNEWIVYRKKHPETVGLDAAEAALSRYYQNMNL